MAFVNEEISQEDLEKSGIRKINPDAEFWTIDRENNMWLNRIHVPSHYAPDNTDDRSIIDWNFYWKSHLIKCKTKTLKSGGVPFQPGWATRKLLSIDIPQDIEQFKPTILKDFENALACYKDGGVLSSLTSFDLTFIVEE